MAVHLPAPRRFVVITSGIAVKLAHKILRTMTTDAPLSAVASLNENMLVKRALRFLGVTDWSEAQAITIY